VLASLHQECDWLQQIGDAWKEVRAGEIDSMKNTRAILGASGNSLQGIPK